MALPVSADRHPLTAIASRSLADEVAARVRAAIVAGELGPGEHLRELDLASRFEVSRSPVRDALVQLDHEGLVRLRRHRGAVVVGLAVEDIDELHSLRLSLERLAIGLAAARARPEDLAELRRTADRIRDAAGAEPAAVVAERDVAFHDRLYAVAGHGRLQACWAMIRPQIYRFLVSRNFVNDDYRAIAASEHHELCDAIAAGDVDASVAMIDRHLEGAYRRLRQEYGAAADPDDDALGPSHGSAAAGPAS